MSILSKLFQKYEAKNRTDLISKIFISNFKSSGKQKDLRALNRESFGMPKILTKAKEYLSNINKKVNVEKNLRNNLKEKYNCKNMKEVKKVLEEKKAVEVKNKNFHEFSKNAKAIDVFKDREYKGKYEDRLKASAGKYIDTDINKYHKYYMDVKLNTRVERDYKNKGKDKSTDIVTIGISKNQMNTLNKLGKTDRVKAMEFLNSIVRTKFSAGPGGKSKYKVLDEDTDIEVDSLFGLYD